MDAEPDGAPVALVTGGTSGIGEETTLELARRGWRVVFVGRDRARCEAVYARAATTGLRPRLDHRLADLSDPRQVRELADGLARHGPAVSVLVNNAGALFTRRELTAQGVERTWALNVLAPYLLTEALWPTLRAHAPARVVNVASEAHRYGHFERNGPASAGRYSGLGTYGASKAAMIQLTRFWADRWVGTGVRAFALHPGFVRSRFATNNRGLVAAGFRFSAALAGIRPATAARYVCRLAADPNVGEESGTYFRKESPSRPAAEATDPEVRARLLAWLASPTGSLAGPSSPRAEAT